MDQVPQKLCKSIGCMNLVIKPTDDFCQDCLGEHYMKTSEQTMSEKYPQYYKSVGDLTEIDVYTVHHLFNIQDPSGAIQHASKKLLLSGVRTGGKSALKDITEARDTLTRWIELNKGYPC